MLTAEVIAQTLAGERRPQRTAWCWRTWCPCHEDHDPSLSVSGDKKILVKCFAGCSNLAVIDELKARNLWPSRDGDAADLPKGRARIIKTYDYRDAQGNLAFQVCRMDPKSFRQRRPDGQGGWVWGLTADDYYRHPGKKDWFRVNRTPPAGAEVKHFPECPPILYRLDELLRADPAAPVFICEGEADADALAALGLVATTCPMGAGKWRKKFNQYFQGKRVIILADNDDPGRAHAQDVARNLHGVAATIKVVELPGLPEKGDVSDWLKAGGTAEQLQALVETAPEWRPQAPAPARLKIDASRPQPRPLEIRFVSGAELQKIEFQDPQWIIDNTLPEGLCLLSARPKKGKTWMAMGFATAVATGGCALGKGELRVPKGKVLYLCLEDRMRRFKKRLKQILQDLPFPEELIIADTWPRLDKGGLEALQDFLKEHDDCRLVVIDSFAKIRPSRPKNVDPYEFDMAMGGALQNLAQQHQICLLIIYHNRKTESEDPLDDVIGSTGLTGAVDAVLVLRRGRGKSDGTLFISGRDVEEQELALRFHPKEGLWEFLGDAAEYAKSQQRQEIIAHLRGSEPQTPKEIAKALDKPYEITKKTLHRMARDGELKSLEGKYELLLLK